MQIVTSIDGLLRAIPSLKAANWETDSILDECSALITELPALDALAPGGSFAKGAVHEILSSTDAPPFLLPVLIARAAAKFGRVIWCDRLCRLHPPAIAALQLPLEKLVILRSPTESLELWALAECLRCAGVSACVAPLGRLSRIQVRRLQLAAEKNGAVGLLLRPASAESWPYAAATRWKVQPAAGERGIQRISIELLHGHGGRLGKSIFVEVDRETHHVRAVETVADRSDQSQIIPASA